MDSLCVASTNHRYLVVAANVWKIVFRSIIPLPEHRLLVIKKDASIMNCVGKSPLREKIGLDCPAAG